MDKFEKKMPAVYDQVERNSFEPAAYTLEEFGNSNAVLHLLKLEFPLSTFYGIMMREGKLKERQAVGK